SGIPRPLRARGPRPVLDRRAGDADHRGAVLGTDPQGALGLAGELLRLLRLLAAPALLLGDDLVGDHASEVFRLVERAQLDLALGEGDAAGPAQGLVHVLALDHPVAADKLLGLGERAVGDDAVAA